MKSVGASTPESVEGHVLRTRPTLNADPSKLHLNERIIGDKTPMREAISKIMRLAQIDEGRLRKDATIANDLVLSISPEFFRPEHPNSAGEWDIEKVETFRTRPFHWAKTFGSWIVSMDLHLDESTPHIHLVVVPIMPKLAENGQKSWRLSSKDMFDPASLKALQQTWEDTLQKHGVGKRLQGSTARHTTLKEYYGSLATTPRPPEPNITSDPPKKGILESDAAYEKKLKDWKNRNVSCSKSHGAYRQRGRKRQTLRKRAARS